MLFCLRRELNLVCSALLPRARLRSGCGELNALCCSAPFACVAFSSCTVAEAMRFWLGGTDFFPLFVRLFLP